MPKISPSGESPKDCKTCKEVIGDKASRLDERPLKKSSLAKGGIVGNDG
jgi:hypothetical protein